jgi:hypothetical protein
MRLRETRPGGGGGGEQEAAAAEPWDKNQDVDGHVRAIRQICVLSRVANFRCPWSSCNRAELFTESAGQYGHTSTQTS